MAGMGGAAGMGTGGVGPSCPGITFVTPANAASLSVVNDLDNDCSNGFTLNVSLAVAAIDGSDVLLLAGTNQLGTAKVSAGLAAFNGVQLDASGATTLTARLASDPTCESSVSVTVACSNVACSISKPVISAAHPLLNGVPVASNGDRVSADGAPYQAAVEVTTNVPDGRTVLLTVDGSAQSLATTAVAGVATFAGVALAPDGQHTLKASCLGDGGQTGTSALVQVGVDSLAPDLILDGIMTGAYFPLNVPVKVCAKTTAVDALDVPTTVAGGQNNFCVGIGTATPQCSPAKPGQSATGDGACVTLACPGGAPFNLALSLRDAAGNVTETTVSGVSCASSLPSVQIIDPIDGTGSDVATRILASGALQVRKDQNSQQAGAQYTVRACTDAAGSTGILYAGLSGSALSTALGSPVTAQPSVSGDNCPSTLGYVFVFSNVDLPESTESATGALTVATALKVQVTDISRTANDSPIVETWVDSTPPTFGPFSPPDLCSLRVQSDVDKTVKLIFNATASPVVLNVDRPTTDSTLNLSTIELAGKISGDVLFEFGINALSGSVTEPSGNVTTLAQPCTVTVGNAPIVAFQSPVGTFNKANDADLNTPGWQGDLSVSVNVVTGGVTGPATSGTVAFSVGGTPVGAGPVNIVAGVATLTGVSIADGSAVQITVTTSDISPYGVGTGSTTRVVDTIAASAVTSLTAAVIPALRRQSAFQVSWNGADDGGKAAGGYNVRRWKSATCDASGFAGGTDVAFGGTPSAPGSADGIQVGNLMIENDYCFGVQPTDSVGNVAPIAVTGPARAQFNSTILTAGVTNDGARFLDGTGDIDGDGYSDLLAGVINGNAAYLYWGSPTGYSTTPDITFSGDVGTSFGLSAKVLGDIDNDGKLDIGISAPAAGGPGKVYIFAGRANWRAAGSTLSASVATYTIAYDATSDPLAAAASLGTSLARLGDFDGDGIHDFAIGAPKYDSNRGMVVVIKGSASFPSTLTLGATFNPAIAFGIKGESSVSNFFGNRLLGLGSFYSGAPGTTLVVSATGSARKTVYTFTKPATGLALASTYQHRFVGTATSTGNTLANLGTILGAPVLGVGSFSTANDTRVFMGSASVGPFGGTTSIYTSSASADPMNTVIGSGLPGTGINVSYIGDSGPDTVFVSSKKLYFMRAAELLATPAGGDVVGLAPVVVSLPGDWRGASWESTPIPDLNGDGYADVAVGEHRGSFDFIGRAAVFW